MEQQLFTTATSVIGSILFLLATIVGWMGSRMMNKLDAVDIRIAALHVDIITRVNALDIRVHTLETKLL